MISNLVRPLQPPPATQKSSRPAGLRRFLSTGSYDLFVWVLLLIYLLPVAYMVVLAFKSDAQREDSHAPWYPARRVTYEYQGHVFDVYHVPTEAGMRRLALAQPGMKSSQFIDPQDPEARLIG
jgi:ABC-type glycerol-3-phosphate transport system permease component